MPKDNENNGENVDNGDRSELSRDTKDYMTIEQKIVQLKELVKNYDIAVGDFNTGCETYDPEIKSKTQHKI